MKVFDGKRVLYKINNMIFQSLQLLAPHIQLGQNEARVEDIEIQETMIFDEPIINATPLKINIETDGMFGIDIS